MKKKSLKKNPLFVLLIMATLAFLGVVLVNYFSPTQTKNFQIQIDPNDEKKLLIHGLTKEEIKNKID